MSPRLSLRELDRLMRERAGLAPLPTPVPLHKMGARAARAAAGAHDGPAAVVIAFPVPPREPNWELIDAVAAEMGLWYEPPRLKVVR
jgi:hypothetical protein